MPGCYASKAKHMTGKPGRSDVKPACKAGKRRRAADMHARSGCVTPGGGDAGPGLSLIHISEPTRPY